MSGWQRIGVVISVLWLVGFPIYLVLDQNLHHANEAYRACRNATSAMVSHWRREGRTDLAEAEERGAHEGCRKGAGYISPTEFAHALVVGDTTSAIFWAFILGPIALLWLIGSATLGTVRWVRRGFTSKRG